MNPVKLAKSIKQLNMWAQRHAPEPETEPRRRLREDVPAAVFGKGFCSAFRAGPRRFGRTGGACTRLL